MPDDRRGLPDAELRESLELMATLVASMSDRLEAQTDALDRVAKVLAETRTAAFAARKPVDPTAYAERFAEIAERRLQNTAGALQHAGQELARRTHEANAALRDAALQAGAKIALAHQEHEAARAWRDRRRQFLNWAGPALLVFLLLTAMLVPRLMAASPILCSLVGGNWYPGTRGPTCAFTALW